MKFLPYVFIYILAVVVRLICLHDFRQVPFFNDLIVDSLRYHQWAMQLVGGNWWGNGVFYQAPLYPYFMALVYTVFGPDIAALRILQVLLAGGGCVALAVAGSQAAGRRVGVLTGLLAALYGPSVFFDCLIQKSVLDGVLLSLFVLLLVVTMQRRTYFRVAALGILLGALTLTRENSLLLLPVLAVFFSPAGLRHIRSSWKVVGTLVAAFLIVLLPVYLRNVSFGSYTALTTYNAGTSYYIGNGIIANGSYVPVLPERGTTELEEQDARAVAEKAEGRSLSADEVSRYWFRRAFDEIADSPGRWLRLMLRKAALVVNRAELADTDDIYYFQQFSMLLRLTNSIFNFAFVFAFAAAGIVLAIRQQLRIFQQLALLAGVMAASLVLLYVLGRYRHPVSILLMPVAAYGLVQLYDLLREKKYRCLAAPGAALAGALLFSLLPLVDVKTQLGSSYFNAAGIYMRSNNFASAAMQYEQAVAQNESDPAMWLNYGVALLNLGQPRDALAAFEQAQRFGAEADKLAQNRANAYLLSGQPQLALQQIEILQHAEESPEWFNTRGAVLAGVGRWDEAIQWLERALQLNPNYAAARRNLEKVRAARDAATAARQ